jgi:hypothetical protein
MKIGRILETQCIGLWPVAKAFQEAKKGGLFTYYLRGRSSTYGLRVDTGSSMKFLIACWDGLKSSHIYYADSLVRLHA